MKAFKKFVNIYRIYRIFIFSRGFPALGKDLLIHIPLIVVFKKVMMT